MNGKIISVFVAVMLCSIAITGCIETDSNESKPIYGIINHSEPIYKTVEHNDPIYTTVEHKDPIYGVEYHKEPVYETIYHKDPIYTTVLTVELDDLGDGDSSCIIDNVYHVDYEYTGEDFWGYENYKVEIYYYTDYTGMTKAVNTYYEINSINRLGSTEIITGYDSWSEQVIIRYDTYPEEIITGYNTWSEEVISGYNNWDEEVITGYNTWSETIIVGYT